MKKLFLGTALFIAACDPAFAQEEICYPPLKVQVAQVSEQIRNAAGECIAKVTDYR